MLISVVYVVALLSVVRGQDVFSTSTIPVRSTTPGLNNITHPAPRDTWDADDIPNPRVDVWQCGRNGRPSSVCDPNRIVSVTDADYMDRLIGDIKRSAPCMCPGGCPTGYNGYQASVAILNKVYMDRNPTLEEKIRVAKAYTSSLKYNRWKFGLCDDEIIVFISKMDRVVYTRIGAAVRSKLPDACVDGIFKNYRQQFTDGDFGAGIIGMLLKYKLILSEDESCNAYIQVAKEIGSNTGYIIFGAVAGVIILGVLLGVVCCCCRGKCSSDGKSHTSYHGSHHYNSDHRSSHHTFGGGGGDDHGGGCSGGGGDDGGGGGDSGGGDGGGGGDF